jgi:hypothetical protein
MYIFTFNINQIDGNNDINILTEFPAILTNNSLRSIIKEIRNIVKTFDSLSAQYKIPIVDFRLGISSLYVKDDFVTMHSFSVNVGEIREVKEIIKKYA